MSKPTPTSKSKRVKVAQSNLEGDGGKHISISLSNELRNWIGRLCWESQFPANAPFPDAIADVVDTVSKYQEEGVVLFPEVLITPDLASLVKTVPNTTASGP